MTDAARMPPLGTAAALALLAGIGVCLGLPWLAPWMVSLLTSLIGVWLWCRYADRRRLIGAVLLGFALTGLHGTYALSLQLPSALEARDFVVSGRIVDLPEREPRRTRFLLAVEEGHEALRGRRVRLAWFDDHKAIASPAPLMAGERWRLKVRLRAPRGLRNPGGFDAEKHALVQRIAATGYVRDPAEAQRLTAASGLLAWREAMSRRIEAAAGGESSRFIQALALGDTRRLSDDDWAVLRVNGLTHLIAISGFHVGMVAGLFAWWARLLWWSLPMLGRRLPARVAAAASGLAGAALYAAVAGFALPTVRTLLMIAIVAGAQFWRRPSPPVQTLAVAGMAIMLVDPLSVLTAGFWLSFLGVAWLLWCLPRGPQPVVRGLLSAQGVATIGLLPVSAALFGQASLVGPVANLIAVPWWSFVVVPLSLLGLGLEALCSGAGTMLWRAARFCFDLSWPGFIWLAATEQALLWLPEPRWFAMPLAVLGAFWLLLPRAVPGKPLAVLLWLPLLWPDRALPRLGEADLTVIDVGQGLSVLVRTAEHSLLYDMGPAVRDGFDAGERAVVPALHALGVRRLDVSVISHADNDHAGGRIAVAREFPSAMNLAPAGSGIDQAQLCIDRRAWEWDGVSFRFLHPPPHFPYLKNESSCVLQVRTADRVLLLTGDIGEVIERDLVRRHGPALRSDVVLAAHHGSAGSSDPAFVTATAAQVMLLSTGHGNRFGHPKPEIIARWQRDGAQVWDTARHGAVHVRLVADGVEVSARRQRYFRWWDAARQSERVRAGLSYRPD